MKCSAELWARLQNMGRALWSKPAYWTNKALERLGDCKISVSGLGGRLCWYIEESGTEPEHMSGDVSVWVQFNSMTSCWIHEDPCRVFLCWISVSQSLFHVSTCSDVWFHSDTGLDFTHTLHLQAAEFCSGLCSLSALYCTASNKDWN